MANARHKRDTHVRRRSEVTPFAAGLALCLTASAVVVGVALSRAGGSGEDLVALDAPVSTAPSVVRSRPAALRPSPSARINRLHVLSRGGIRRVDPEHRPMPAGHDGNGAAAGPPRRPAVRHAYRATATPDPTPTAKPTAKPTATAPPTAPPTASAPPGSGALSDAPCPDTSVEDRLAADTIRLYRAVCHAFPQVTHYLGWGARSEHDTGHAIDVMVYDDKALGDQIAAWAQAHAAELNLYDVLWYQHIWTPVRASEGWRLLPDRGSPTANHMDHVHIGTN